MNILEIPCSLRWVTEICWADANHQLYEDDSNDSRDFRL